MKMSEEVNNQDNTNDVEPTPEQSSEDTTLLTEEAKTEETVDATEDKKVVEEKKETENIEYSDFVIPEGFEFNEDALNRFKEVSKESNVPQETAQKYIDLYTEIEQQKVEAQERETQEIVEGWKNEIKSDPEFGGTKFDETIIRAKRTLHQFGNDNLKEVLIASGLGNHPEIIKLLAKVDKVNGEETGATPNPQKTPPSTAEVFFGNKT
jgi:hypothetical protein